MTGTEVGQEIEPVGRTPLPVGIHKRESHVSGNSGMFRVGVGAGTRSDVRGGDMIIFRYQRVNVHLARVADAERYARLLSVQGQANVDHCEQEGSSENEFSHSASPYSDSISDPDCGEYTRSLSSGAVKSACPGRDPRCLRWRLSPD